MIELMVESQIIMDKDSINEKYCDSIIAIASEFGWSIEYILELPPWTITQIIESKNRINKQLSQENTLINNKNNKLLGV